MASNHIAIWVAAAALAFSASAANAAEPPRRIVSFNLCADQLVVALADPGQIAGVSPYAADPEASVVADRTKQFRRLDWQAESTLALDPDLILVGPYDRPTTRRLLQRFGLRLAIVEVVSDLESARAQMLEVAALLGHPARGAAMAEQLDAARLRLLALRRIDGGTALPLDRGSYSAGAGSLLGAMLREAGFRAPDGAPAGLGGMVSLERLILMRPDVLVTAQPAGAPTGRAQSALAHPAVRDLVPAERQLVLPTRFTLCGGPAVIAGLNALADALERKP